MRTENNTKAYYNVTAAHGAGCDGKFIMKMLNCGNWMPVYVCVSIPAKFRLPIFLSSVENPPKSVPNPGGRSFRANLVVKNWKILSFLLVVDSEPSSLSIT
jgi:hypothetical protein